MAIRRLLDGVRARFGLGIDAEITLEANPGTVDEAHFAGYADAGVNRLSIGVQSLSAGALRQLGRIHGPEDVTRTVAAARAAGIANLNLDLMFALPGQDLAMARDDLERLIALEPAHISYYELTLEPNTAFYQQPPALPDPDLADAIQQQGFMLLAAAGFERYEISAFARPGRRCHHNLNYWRFGDYLGIGAGAHGKLTDLARGTVERRTKRRHPDAYLTAADPTSAVRTLSEQDLIEEFALNACRLVEGFTTLDFERVTGLSANRLEPGLRAAGELGLVSLDEVPSDALDDVRDAVRDQALIRPTPRGLAFLNDLVGCFSV
jgi:oxygen-independent coproporphyrinogen-3 oxidase